MSISAVGFCVILLVQTGPLDGESQLQFNPLQSPAVSEPQEPQGVGLASPQATPSPESAVRPESAANPEPAGLQPPDSSALRSVYGGPVADAADSPPALNQPPALRQSPASTVSQPPATLVESAPAVLATSSPAELLLRQSLQAPDENPIPGRPVALRTLLGHAAGESRQVETVRAYWRLTRAVADYHFAVAEHQFLAAVPAGREDQLSLAAAQASAKAEQAEARLTAVRAQQALVKVSPQADGGQLPLPADLPLVGAYRTHFQELNQHGVARDELGAIDQSLPVIRDVIDAQAGAVEAAAAALAPALQAYQQGQASLAQVLDAHERLRRHRRAFLTAVEQYNAEIAGYALAVSLPTVTGERIAALLIHDQPLGKSVLAGKKIGGDIQRVSNEEPVAEEAGGVQFRTPRMGNP